MRRTSVVLVLVLLVGYSAYGAMFLTAGAMHESLSSNTAFTKNATAGSTQPDHFGPEFEADPFRFEEVKAGLNYTFAASDQVVPYKAGVYTADYNDDGWADVLAVGGRRPVLFENVNGSFEPSGELPRLNGTASNSSSQHVGQWVDFNVDGRPDILLLPEDKPPLLLENTGGGFEKRPSAFKRPLENPVGATTADYDRDGCPDLLVYQNGDWTDRLPLGNEKFSAPVNDDNGNPDVLYRGTCSGFERTSDNGIRGARWTLAASFVDLNGDGYPDIHQASDYNHDIIYLNQQNGSFDQVVLPERTNRNGMSSEVADINGNGRLDVFVTNIYFPEVVARKLTPGLIMRAHGNNLITRLTSGAFVERANQYNITRGGWGWAAVITDFDNDGDEDLFHTTREMNFNRRDVVFTDKQIKQLQEVPYYRYPAVWARTDNMTFRPMDPKAAGFTPTNGRGVARLDYDRDGDPDLIVAGNDAYRVYENRMDRGNAIQVRILGANGSQTEAYGATVTVEVNGRTQTRRVHARTDFLSQDSRLVHVGVGNTTGVDVRVVWPDGTERRFENQSVGQRIVVTPNGIVRAYDLTD